jgi:mannose-6-phosphate isomerase
MDLKERILKLEGKVQHYAWGGYNYIPQLLGLENPDCEPYAEYWMGAHPSASSKVTLNNNDVSLNQLVTSDPTTYITKEVYDKFGELPYLFKILDVKDMLSIQVHPSKEEAAKGFEAEEAAGVPINAPHRNYKDKNHKPEVMVALSEFWLLHGFKQQDELKRTLSSVPEFRYLLPVFEQQGYSGLYKEVMELPQDKVDELLLPLVERELSRRNQLQKNEPGYWVTKLFKEGQELKNIDKGIFSIYFFNIVEVHPGEAVFQGAGIPHAYLEGQNVELMANSDNVLRGGLTPKHIDVPELLKHTTFEGVRPNILRGESLSDHEKNYPCPVSDFGISSVELGAGQTYQTTSASAEIYIIISGAIDIAGINEQYKKGCSFFVRPGTQFSIRAKEPSILYKAFVP